MLKQNISAENNSSDSQSNDNSSSNTRRVTTNAKTRRADIEPERAEQIRKQDRERYKRRKETDPEGLKAATKIKNARRASVLNMDPKKREIINANQRRDNMDPDKLEKLRQKDRERARLKREMAKSPHIPFGAYASVSEIPASNDNNDQAAPLNFDDSGFEIQATATSLAIPVSSAPASTSRALAIDVPEQVAWIPDSGFFSTSDISSITLESIAALDNEDIFPFTGDDAFLADVSSSQPTSTAALPENVTCNTTSEEQFDEIPMLQKEEGLQKDDQIQRAFLHKNKSLTVKELITQIQNSKGIEPAAKALKIGNNNLEDLLLKHFMLIDETTQMNFFHGDKARIIFEFLWTLSPNEINSIFGQSLDQPLLKNQWYLHAHPHTFECLHKTKKSCTLNFPTSNNETIKCRRSNSDTNNNNQDDVVVVISSRKPRQRSKENPLEIVSNAKNHKQNEMTVNQQKMNESAQIPKKSSNNHSRRYITFAVMEKRLALMTVKEFIDLIRKSKSIYVLANKLNYNYISLEQFLLDRFIFVDAASQKALFHSNRGDMIYRFFRMLSEKQLETLFDDNFHQPIAGNKWRFHSEENNFEIFNNAPKPTPDIDITIKSQRIRSNSSSQLNSFNQDDLVSITYNPCRKTKAPSSSTSFNLPNSTSQTTSNLFHHSACPMETTQTNENLTFSVDPASFL